MTTFYIRRRSGPIVNAVECQNVQQAERVISTMCQDMRDPLWPDPDPPLSVLEQYRYWNERP